MTPPDAGPERLFGNLIPCDRPEFPFVDRFAQFAVVFEAGRPLGPGELQVRSCMLHQAAAEPLLSLWLEHDGEAVPVTRQDLCSLPWVVEESGGHEAGRSRLSVSATHAFADELRLVSRFRVAHGAGPAAFVRPRWRGAVSPERMGSPNLRLYGCAEAAPRVAWLAVAGAVVTGGLRNRGDGLFLPAPAVRVECIAGPGVVAGAVDATSDRLEAGGALERHGSVGERLAYGFDGAVQELGPGTAVEYVFVTTLAVADWRHPELAWPVPLGAEDLAIEALVLRNREHFLVRAARVEPGAAASRRPARVRRAAWALLRTGYQGHADRGEIGPHVASTCVPVGGGFTHIFFWDSLFTAVALVGLDPAFARGAIHSVFCRQTEEGYCPEHVFNYWVEPRHTIGAPQAPVATWAVARYLAQHPGDEEFLAAILPALERNFAYWRDLADRDRDGLAEWTWSGQTADTSPIYDEFKDSRAGCVHLPPVASVALNSFLYRDALLLADLLERRGRGAEAAACRADAARRQEALLRWCFVPGERRFWDYNHATRRHRRVRTFYLFWPLWAGMDVPADVKRDLIENVLLDPAQFFGPVPFPSVAYDEPTYYNGSRTEKDGRAWWRGRAWPHISYWLVETLMREGYRAEAEEAVRRLLRAHDREPSFPEHLSTNPSDYHAGGHKDYNWGAAAYYLLATGAHRSEAAQWDRLSFALRRTGAGGRVPVA